MRTIPSGSKRELGSRLPTREGVRRRIYPPYNNRMTVESAVNIYVLVLCTDMGYQSCIHVRIVTALQMLYFTITSTTQQSKPKNLISSRLRFLRERRIIQVRLTSLLPALRRELVRNLLERL